MYWECYLIQWYFVTALTLVIINTAFHKIFFQYLPIASLLLTNLNSLQLVSDLSHRISQVFYIKPIKDISPVSNTFRYLASCHGTAKTI